MSTGLLYVDPVGELRLAKQRIHELEKGEALQRDEVGMKPCTPLILLPILYTIANPSVV